MIEEIIIYGAGQRGRGLYTLLKNAGINIVYVIDSDIKKHNQRFYDTTIASPDVLLNDHKTPVCIVIAREEHARAVRKTLREKYQVSVDREIKFFNLLWDLYQADSDIQSALKGKARNENPQIIFECDYGLGLGGIEAWTKSICSELISNGKKNLSIISDSGEYDTPPAIKDRVVQLPINHDEMFGSGTIVSIIHYLLGQMPCVLVTGQFYVSLLAACLVKQRYPDQIKIISVIHFGQEELYWQYASVRQYVDRYIGVSRDIIDGLKRHGVSENKIDHMTCPVDCDVVLERKYTIDTGRPVRLGFAGRVNAKQKRMDLVPYLANELDERHVNYYFEIAGDGDYCEKLNEFIAKNGLGRRIRLVGKLDREQIGAFWRDKDICISLSDYEGRSISIMEAMANGAVPVVTETSGVQEDIFDGDNGYIVALQDVKTMAERICCLEKHRELTEVMGRRAHDTILPKCQMRDHLKYWENMLDEKCGGLYGKEDLFAAGI